MNPRYGRSKRNIPTMMIMIPTNFAREPAKKVTTPRIIRKRGLTVSNAEYAEPSADGPVLWSVFITSISRLRIA